MNRKLFIIIIKVTVLMMALFFMSIILNSNTSFAYVYRKKLNRVDISGNASEFFEVPKGEEQIPNAPIRGIRVQLTDKHTGQIETTLTNTNGDYLFEDVPEGEYSLEYTYGDIGILDEEFEDPDLKENLTKKDILKYNGHDYIISDTQEESQNTYIKLEKNSVQVFFVIDTSGSMDTKMTNNETGEQLTRLEVVKDAAKQLAKSILDENEKLNEELDLENNDEDHDIYIGLISFHSYITDALATYPNHVTKDYDVISQAIDNLETAGDTNVSPAITAARDQMIKNSIETGNPDSLKIVIFLSDGLPAQDKTKYATEEELEQVVKDSAASLNESDIKLYTLLIVGDTKGLDEYENVAELDSKEFKNVIEYDEETAKPTEEYIKGYSFINNYHYWYPYIGYLNHIYELYKDYSDKLVFHSSADSLSNCMSNTIKSWIDEEISEYEANPKHNQNHEDLDSIEIKTNDESEPECGWEDEDRRKKVDSYFSDTFHNNTSTDSNDLSGQSYLFKIIDDPDSFSNKQVKNFSNHTKMYIVFDVIIDKTTQKEVFNICLKRRNEFSLKVANRVVQAKLTLNTGQVVYSDCNYSSLDFDDENHKPYIFKKEIDSELLHGALIELEYEITIKNLSPNIECTYLDLISYLPPGLYFSENSQLLSNSQYTNYDTGWNIEEKEDLIKLGYLDHSDSDLINRHYIITFSHPLGENDLLPQDTYTTKFVLSTYITNVEDFALYNNSNNDKDIVEIFGYRNKKNRRMEYKNKETEKYTSVITKIEAETPEEEDIYVGGETNYRATYTSVYPGNGKEAEPDYAMDYNDECVIPVTGAKPNYTNHNIIAIIIILSSILIIIKPKIKLKK